ncbi:ABC transporter substrate-binding protein [Ruania alba]|uniref:Peptide/nickel transport system substrate-binding protein n=1 Tax=Ruania alba TaxID=648782 RepID=A0A1H5LGI2_9MICO|nr:ABC transporter substrate-binding protein [Ruania alba]SEE75298.1 peptide/nickel transport system substrate-binding protein [Ruania alba]
MFPHLDNSSAHQPMWSRAVSRRSLLLTGGGLAATASLAGCSFFDTDPAQNGDGGASSGPKGPEAPSLAAQVEAGDLPPVEERLPRTPLVVEPNAEIGQYGGTWRSAMITQDDTSWLDKTVGYEPFVRWARDWTNSPGTEEILPNIAESFRELEDGSVFEFTLREGLRWSDGEPVTVDDYRFAFEDCNASAEFHPFGIYSMWTNPSDGSPATFEQVDDWTIRYIFDGPKPGWLHEQCRNRVMVLPKHYLKEFHPTYNPDVDELVAAEGHDDWIQLLQVKSQNWMSADLPTLHAWRLVEAIGDGDAVVCERNPYYWKTDPDGSQLPYIDEFRADILLDPEVEVLQITNGDLDMQMGHFNTIENLPVISDNAESGGYRLFDVGPAGTNAIALAFNQTMTEGPLAGLFRNKDFRVGISHAINRQRVIDSVYSGQAIPWQIAPLEGQYGYDEEMGTQYTEFSVEKANEALDQAGLTETDSDGIRLFEGSPVEFSVLVRSEESGHIDALELIVADCAEVGIRMNVQPVAASLFWERVEAGASVCSVSDAGFYEPRPTMGSNHYWVPSNPRGSSMWGHEWSTWWRSDGSDGSRPPEPWRRSLDLFEELLHTYDTEEASALSQEILAIAKEQFNLIGVCTRPTTYGIATNTMGNVPASLPGESAYTAPGPSHPEHYFFGVQDG